MTQVHINIRGSILNLYIHCYHIYTPEYMYAYLLIKYMYANMYH